MVTFFEILDKKIEPYISIRLYNLILALSTFPGRLQPSIINVLDFTSVFGMGTGVAPKLYAPENFSNFFLGYSEIFVNVGNVYYDFSCIFFKIN